MDRFLTIETVMFTVVAGSGVFFHVVKKWYDDEIKVSVADWFLNNPKSTVAMCAAVFGSLWTAIATGAINDPNDMMQIGVVFLWGFSCNSAVNKQ